MQAKQTVYVIAGKNNHFKNVIYEGKLKWIQYISNKRKLKISSQKRQLKMPKMQAKNASQKCKSKMQAQINNRQKHLSCLLLQNRHLI